MSKLTRRANQAFRERERYEAALMRDMTRQHARVRARLRDHLGHLTREIAQARRDGTDLSPGWLQAQSRTRSLLADLEADTMDFARRAQGMISEAQGWMVDHATSTSWELIKAGMGAGPRSAFATLEARYRPEPKLGGALDQLIGYSTDGRPLGILLSQLGPEVGQTVRDSLSYGVATGKPLRQIGKEISDKAGLPLVRAQTIARTEILRSHREASRLSMQASGIERWQWWANPGSRTCAMCLSNHGRTFPITTPFYGHVNDRCAVLPLPNSWGELGIAVADRRPHAFTSGPDLFDQMSRDQKLEIVGPGKLKLIESGQIKLRDLSVSTFSPVWGKGRREATLGEAKKIAARRRRIRE